MKIVQVLPGSGGGFYCENCVRDSGLVAALRAAGHDAVVAPMYLPPVADGRGGPAGETPVFYGAIRVYLQERLPWLGRLPGRLLSWLDAPCLLRWAAGRAGSTRARGLEEMTLSMLRGEEGRQRAELARLCDWLAQEQPEVVHLSNALLLGLARTLKRRLGVAIVCSLQDEDQWVLDMRPDYADRIWRTMAERAGEVDLFLAVSEYYAGVMRRRLELPAARLRVLYPGVDTEVFAPASAPPPAPVIGYLSRQHPDFGLDLLAEAFIRLRREPALRAARLAVAGGDVGPDLDFVARIKERLRDAGALDAAVFLPALAAPERAAFLRGLSVLSVPMRAGEALGLFLFEAMACGVPVVQPQAGAFPEIIEQTGGGMVLDALGVDELAAALRGLLLDGAKARELGARGRRAVCERFSLQQTARATAAAYAQVLARAGGAAPGAVRQPQERSHA